MSRQLEDIHSSWRRMMSLELSDMSLFGLLHLLFVFISPSWLFE